MSAADCAPRPIRRAHSRAHKMRGIQTVSLYFISRSDEGERNKPFFCGMLFCDGWQIELARFILVVCARSSGVGCREYFFVIGRKRRNYGSSGITSDESS